MCTLCPKTGSHTPSAFTHAGLYILSEKGLAATLTNRFSIEALRGAICCFTDFSVHETISMFSLHLAVLHLLSPYLAGLDPAGHDLYSSSR